MYLIVRSLQEAVRLPEGRLHRRGASATGLLVAILAAVGLLVVLSYVF